MNMLRKIIMGIKNPGLVLVVILKNPKISQLFSDTVFLKIVFLFKMGRRLNLQNPKTYNEKLQWLKLYYKKEIFTVMVDKYKVRDLVAQEIGEEYLIPLLGAWDKVEDIDFSNLPNSFVLKCNHNSGLGMQICKDKHLLNIDKAKKELRKGLQQQYFWQGREWPYKNVQRKIIAETFMTDESGELRDYKLFCFNGKVDSIMVCSGRNAGDVKFYYYNTFWDRLTYQTIEPEGDIDKPSSLNEMIKLAMILSKGLPHLRVDFYCISGKIYFGEMTFFTSGGMDKDITYDTDLKLGKLIDLSSIV